MAMSARSHTRSHSRSRIRSLLPVAIPALLGVGLALSAAGVVPLEGFRAGPGGLGRPGLPLSSLAAVPRPTPPPAIAPGATTSAMAPAAAVTIVPLPSPGRQVHVQSVNTGEKAIFNIGPRGYVPPDQLAAVEEFFRCRRTERQHPIAPGVLVMLADIADRWPGRTIEIISGFRAAPYGAPHSRHFIGHAIDLRVHGVRTSLVRDFVWREHEGIGVGHYAEGNFVHVDSRPDDQDIAWSAPEEASLPQYNPAWARRARRGLHRGPGQSLVAALTVVQGGMGN